MKAMIFAAGLGTRLRPITNHIPKAMVAVNGRTLLEWNLLRLKSFGYTEIMLNLHHYPDLIKGYLKLKDYFGLQIYFSHEQEQLLNTGGGLWNVANFFKDAEPFLLCNVDILSTIDLRKFRAQHISTGALATLAIRERESSRYLLFDSDKQLCAWKNQKTGEIKEARPGTTSEAFAFSGIQMLSPQIFTLYQSEVQVFSIIDVYLQLAKQHKIEGYLHTQDAWLDVGKHHALKEAEKLATPKLFSY